MSHRLAAASLLLLLVFARSGFAQSEPPPPTPPPAPQPTTTPAPPTTSVSTPLAGTATSTERRDSFPNVNVYLPEGEASIRLRKLIRNVLFESQINYKFLNGDISTYLRYKYYARTFTYRIGVFDSIEFPDVGERSTVEFERVRGGLLLVGIPRNYSRRYFWLLQNDRLTFGNLMNVDDRKNNIYTKFGFQYGTQFDERMNAIVGESRGRITPVLTAFRDIGPQKTGVAFALTQSGRVATGDYNYTKLEGEGLRRFDVGARSFIFSRAHVGAFLTSDLVRGEEFDQLERYSIPRYEMFKLGGREAIKAINDNEFSQGTHELHLTNEYFRPIFSNRDYKTGPLHWNTMYGIAYVGAGTVGFEYNQLTKLDRYVVDAGLGTETSIGIRDFEVILSVIYAKTLKAPDELKDHEVRFSVRTKR